MSLRTIFLGATVLVGCGDPNDPAARAVSVQVLTAARSLLAGDTMTLSAQARDAEGRGVPGVPLTWSSSDPTQLIVVDAVAGVVTAMPARGTVYAHVTLPSGASDSVALRVQPRPVSLDIVSGDGQQGIMNNRLRDPLVVAANAEDGFGVEGVIVAFAVVAGQGLVSDAMRVTDSLGRANVVWTLGEAPQQQLEAIALVSEGPRTAFESVAMVPGTWTWMAGDSVRFVPPVYGMRGVPDAGNSPGSRTGAVHATGSDGTVWLFGGGVFSPSFNLRNDLWQFRDGVWVWVAGSDQPNPPAVYGARGLPDPGNVPSGRQSGSAWVDGSGHFWVFGSADTDDLWRFDGTAWTWMAGDSVPGRPPTYGQPGVSASSNTPGVRFAAAEWADSEGRLWLFGGSGRADLWRFAQAGWAWVGGDSALDGRVRYGEMGQLDGANTPGVRSASSVWFENGVLSLYGGTVNASGTFTEPADLWRLSGTTWAWVGGSQGTDVAAEYGRRGAYTAGSSPGSRRSAAAAASGGVTWMFGGLHLNAFRNDLWQFDGTRWVWLAGSDRAESSGGRWGIRGVGDATTTPSARFGSVLWVDVSGSTWLYGGNSHNDLWRYDATRVP